MFLAFVCCLGTLRADEPIPEDALFRKTLHSAAWVSVGSRWGTGFVVDRARRLLVTNAHVVARSEAAAVRFPLYRGEHVTAERSHYVRFDRPIRGQVLGADPRRDLAVLELEVLPPEVIALPLAKASPEPGEPIHLIGNPGASDFLWVYNRGSARQVVFTSKKDGRTGKDITAFLLEVRTDNPIKPGYSGGPVVNADGKLVGVTTLVNTRQPHEAWCVDVREVRDVVSLAEEAPRDAYRFLDPHTVRDYRERGILHHLHGREDRAVADLTEATRLSPDDAKAYQWRARAYRKKGEAEKAEADEAEAARLEAALKK